MLKKTIIAFILVVGIIAIFYIANVFIIRQSTFETLEETYKPDSQPIELTLPEQNIPTSANNGDAILHQNSPETSQKTIQTDITRDDCKNECNNFIEDTLQYCKQVCGLVYDEYINDCSTKKNLEKDYCWKSKAIEESNYTLCNKISDENISQTCANRITEDIIDTRM